MGTVQQLLQKKGSEIWSVTPEQSISEAISLMAEKNIGALPVIDDMHPVGIFSERDFARTVAQNNSVSLDIAVKEFMSEQIICVSPRTTTQECMALMTEKRIRHLPVLENNTLRGIISIGDVVKTVISEQEFMIEQLETYIVQ